MQTGQFKKLLEKSLQNKNFEIIFLDLYTVGAPNGIYVPNGV